jgi:hypothetical protein
MKIQYNDGTSRIVANDAETIKNIIREDCGDDAVIYAGYVWNDESSSENAVAKLWNDEGDEFTDELEIL